MEKLNRGLQRGGANKKNGVPTSEQDASAGFEKVFQACAEDGKAFVLNTSGEDLSLHCSTEG